MKQARCLGFTLIELLLVISIIVLLMTLLIPSVGSAMQAVKVTNARRCVDTLHKAVLAYKDVYGAPPPDKTPNPSMDMTKDTSYPLYRFADGRVDGTVGSVAQKSLFNDGNWNERAFGGKFLVYFLMGPYGTGWHRPKELFPNDPNYRLRGLTKEWDPPSALSAILENSPVPQGLPGDLASASGKPFAVFVDGFGLDGNNGGVIGYIRENLLVKADKSDRWGTLNNGPFGAAMYGDCRSHPSYPGDDKPTEHLKKMLDQCPGDFALISPGADRKYGYRVTSMLFNGVYRKGSWANMAGGGVIDDIANYPLN